jgi:DNA polymerase IV
MKEEKVILLADMNSFFASCHQSEDTSLQNKPVIVGGAPSNKMKGKVIAASYEAKDKGIYTTMSMYEALKKCPNAIVVQRNHSLYHTYSQKIMTFLRLIGDTEVASIDEAYVDITERVKNGNSSKSIASYIQKTLWEKLSIPCSIGIGPNKIIAKMAADVKKPMGCTIFNIEQFCVHFHPLPLGVLHGCGKKTEEKLNAYQLTTIGDLAKADTFHLKMILGIRGEILQKSALGISSNKVNADRQKGDKTIGKERTFSKPTDDQDLILSVGRTMVELLSQRLEDKRLKARTIAVVYKTESGQSSHSKSITLMEPVANPETIYYQIENLYEEYLIDVPLWLFGVRLSNFDPSTFVQLRLFE